ncbi:helix-turn-helix domain-containing protein [Mycobacterium sp. 663a-19]|nr:helix-turn-helix domain-containing protein [Mycobacterium sp. 663a-19]
MEPRWPPLQEPTARKAWNGVLKPVAAQLQTCAPQLAARIVERLRADLPTIVPDATAVAEQLASVEAILRQLAQCIEIGDDPRGFDIAPPTAVVARSGVQRNIALNELVRSVRLGQQQTWQWLFERVTAAQAGERDRALGLATDLLFAYCDALLVQAEHLYEVEREAWLRGAAAARAAAVDDILADREDDPQRASKRLRYDINRHHVGVSMWLDATHDAADTQTVLTEALTQLAGAVSAQSNLIHPAGSMALVAWLSRPQPFAAAGLEGAHICGKARLPQGVWVAIGEPGWGIGGFRRTHTEAAHAHRFASLLGDRADVVTRYRDVAVAALASTDGVHAMAFAKRVLGPLAADDEATYRVATTLAVYLEENRSPAKAAQRLTVHPNTVSYRVHRAEELLGRPIDTNILDLSVALALLPALRGLRPATASNCDDSTTPSPNSVAAPRADMPRNLLASRTNPPQAAKPRRIP